MQGKQARCKKCNSNRFVTTAHEVHDWLVDNNGEFVDDMGCVEVAHSPSSSNVWTCYECGTEATMENNDG